ncbi:MAG: hypothetical protein JW913_03860 [Chitinispirillaceae bacterium]|nr:hypothetical protein [Chitinispirillaceae bacterium]
MPFPFPEKCQEPKDAWRLVRESAKIFNQALCKLDVLSNREEIENDAQSSVEEMIYSYFEIDDTERMVIADTVNVLIPSFHPRTNQEIPALLPSTERQRQNYLRCLTGQLNGWARKDYKIHVNVVTAPSLGIGMVVLEKVHSDSQPVTRDQESSKEIIKTLSSLQRVVAKTHGTYELVRGLKVFHKNHLYITKPLGQRFWTYTAALNDADEIAATILTRSERD